VKGKGSGFMSNVQWMNPEIRTDHSLTHRDDCVAKSDVLRRVSKIAKKPVLDSSYLSFPMQQPCSHSTDFHEILYLGIFRKFVAKMKVSLKSEKK
jgi:hypothetical protein